MLRIVTLIALLTVTGAGHAELQPGKVVRVIDGDTVDVLTGDQETVRVRLAAIDCPEKRRKQPYWRAAKEALAARVANQDLIVDWHKKDRWGRLIGVLRLDGADINAELVRIGACWHFKRYAKEQAPEDRMLYARLEVEAREAGAGLWALPSPVAPWEWRKHKALSQ